MRWLVVRDVLPRYAESVNMILHERHDAVFGWNGSDVDAEGLIIGGAPDNFFSPVAKKVGA